VLTVYKYRVYETPTPVLQLPSGAALLHLGEENDSLYVWALVDTEQPYEQRDLMLAGTGWEMPATPGRHVGTVQMRNGLVFHLFEGGGQ